MDLHRALHLGAYPARTHCCPVDCLGRPRPLLLLSPKRFLSSSSLHNFLSRSFCSIAFSRPSLDLCQAELLTRGGWGGGLLLRPRSQLGKPLLLQSLLLSPFLPLPLLLLQSDKSLVLSALSRRRLLTGSPLLPGALVDHVAPGIFGIVNVLQRQFKKKWISKI